MSALLEQTIERFGHGRTSEVTPQSEVPRPSSARNKVPILLQRLVAARREAWFTARETTRQRGLAMMGRLRRDQGQLFYSFCLDKVVPRDHPVREIAAVLDLSWVRAELAPHYPHRGRHHCANVAGDADGQIQSEAIRVSDPKDLTPIGENGGPE